MNCNSRSVTLPTGEIAWITNASRWKCSAALYERAGFVKVDPFDDYVEDPLSVFYEIHLTERARIA